MRLDEERERCKELTYDYNLTRPREAERRRDLLKQLLGSCGNSIWIEPPVHMAYGKHVHIGDGFYTNFNLVQDPIDSTMEEVWKRIPQLRE